VTEIAEVINPEVVAMELTKVQTEARLTTDEQNELSDKFKEFYSRITDWRGKVVLITNPEDPRQQKMAREIRLGLKDVRCDVERARKTLKEDAVRRGKAVDGYANVLKYLCQPVEDKLEQIEKMAEYKEAERIQKLIEARTALILSEGGDSTIYNFGNMTDEAFVIILRSAQDARVKREEEAKRMEEERIAKEQADIAEREAQRKENERLKAEADAAAAAAKIEREKAKAAAAEAEAVQVKMRNQLKAEREAREAAEASIIAAKQAEDRRRAQVREDEQAQLRKDRLAREATERAPDKEKLEAFCSKIMAVSMGTTTTEAGATVAREAIRMQGKMVEWIRTQIAKM
jgi:hypothetical protein